MITNDQIKELMLFLGYEFVEVGYWDGDDETQWQRDNKEWMDKVEMTDVGEYFIWKKNDEFINLYRSDWEAILPIQKDWNWIIALVEKIESLEFPHDEFKTWNPKVTISNKRCIISDCWYLDMINFWQEGENKINAVYGAILTFIKWYKKNDNKRKS